MPIPNIAPNEKPKTARERIYTILRDWIIDGTLKPEEKILDSEISQYFSVSRTPVREAMQILADQKLIQIFPGRESRVSPINLDKMEQCYILLAEIHAIALKFAFPNINEKIIKMLERYNETILNAAKSEDPVLLRSSDQDFHSLFVKLADNDFLSDFSSTLTSHVIRTENIYYSMLNNYAITYDEHKAIIEALKKQDLEEAMACMKRNWLHTIEIINENENKGTNSQN